MNRSGQLLCTITLTAAGVLARPVAAELLFSTDFENHPAVPPPGQWAGIDGWVRAFSTAEDPRDPGINWQGIDQDAIPGGGLGRTASIGYKPPSYPGSRTWLGVYRPVGYDPAPGDPTTLEFESLLGIQDYRPQELDPTRDSFWIYFYNSNGIRLAGIRFSNEDATYGIWRSDGLTQQDTGIGFISGELHLLFVRLDLATNRWSAYLDGIPLFNGTPFTGYDASQPRNLLAVGVEWRKGGNAWGDNWMLVADWYVRSSPFGVDTFTRAAGGSVVRWTGDAGYDYQVEYSQDMATWHGDLDGSAFPGVADNRILTFTDPAAGVPGRCYRVVRTISP